MMVIMDPRNRNSRFMQTSLPEREIVLWGIGHTNAHVLRMWRMRPIPNTRLTCVSNDLIATYSGMLPGVLSGQYPRDAMELDLVRLCAAAGARLIVEDVVGIDLNGQRLRFQERPPIPFDALSIGIGSVPSLDGVRGKFEDLIPIKPMTTFLDRLESRLVRVRDTRSGRPVRIVVVGGGAGGVEIAFGIAPFVTRVLAGNQAEIALVHAGDALNAGTLSRTNALVQRRLTDQGIRLLLGRLVVAVHERGLTLNDGEHIAADAVIWATGAAPPPILGTLGLPLDEGGFPLTRPSLQTLADAPIFVVGDSGTIATTPTAKAGVFAVRQGPILWRNLNRVLAGKPLAPYRPQATFLKLINTGDGRAIGEYRGFTFEGSWTWRLKNFIDRRFMDKFQANQVMSSPPPPARVESDPPMRCTGCGGKIGGAILARVLRRLDPSRGAGVLVGLDTPDDAAIVQPPEGRPLALTVDFFNAPLDDAYLVGRLSALHAASDAFAMRARPLWALALATLPLGGEPAQEQILHEWLAGSVREFEGMGASLVGGHTIEGQQLTVGFTIAAATGTGPPRVKGSFRSGDHLILTKPIGTGLLLAAQARALCPARRLKSLLESMLTSNDIVDSLLAEFDIAGVTDVTGFGLAGHLLEVLEAGGLDAHLNLDQIALLPGVSEVLSQGIESTLAPANRAAESAIESSSDHRESAAYKALFDPQTCGGLLIGATEDQAAAVMARLREAGPVTPSRIGTLTRQAGSRPRIHINASG